MIKVQIYSNGKYDGTFMNGKTLFITLEVKNHMLRL